MTRGGQPHLFRRTTCYVCWSAKNLELHHLHWRRGPECEGENHLRNLVVLCARCHEVVHRQSLCGREQIEKLRQSRAMRSSLEMYSNQPQ